MPYRIKARSNDGHTVTRMDLDYRNKPILDKAYATTLAEDFAKNLGRNKTWTPIVEYYSESIQNPNFEKRNARD